MTAIVNTQFPWERGHPARIGRVRHSLSQGGERLLDIGSGLLCANNTAYVRKPVDGNV